MTAAIVPCSTHAEFGQSGGQGGSEAADFSAWLELAATGQATVVLVAGGSPSPAIESNALAASESRVYLEHVLANGYLSNVVPSIAGQLDIGTEGPHWSHALPPSPDAHVGLGAVTGRGAAAGEAARPAPAGKAMQAFVSLGGDAEQAESPARCLATAAADTGAPGAVWAERLLRATREPGEQVTLWMRDFRLPEGEVSRAIQQLRSLARLQGWNLGRVVINGLERWSVAGLQEQPGQSWEVSCP